MTGCLSWSANLVIDWCPVQRLPCFSPNVCWDRLQPVTLHKKRGLENGCRSIVLIIKKVHFFYFATLILISYLCDMWDRGSIKRIYLVGIHQFIVAYNVVLVSTLRLIYKEKVTSCCQSTRQELIASIDLFRPLLALLQYQQCKQLFSRDSHPS